MCPQSDSTFTADFCLSFPQGELAVYRFGQGPKILIALHGFDDKASSYATWCEALGAEYSIYAIDLPFHGTSAWLADRMRPADVWAIISAVLSQLKTTSFSIVGHSFGARILLCTAHEWAHLPEQIILLAPAGIGSYDRVAPIWLQRIGEGLLRWPAPFKFFVQLGWKMGLVSKFHWRYAEVQLYPAAQRYRLFRVFNSLVHFSTTSEPIRKFWQQTTMSCLVVVATQDRFVDSEKIKVYFAELPPVDVVEVIGSHQMINDRIARVVKEAIS